MAALESTDYVGTKWLLIYKMRVIRPLHNSPLELAINNL
jgi:hypothetical protein